MSIERFNQFITRHIPIFSDYNGKDYEFCHEFICSKCVCYRNCGRLSEDYVIPGTFYESLRKSNPEYFL